MNRQTALKGIVSGLLLAATLAAAGCGGGPKIAVGSMNSTEQILLAEIVAQHLEHRLARKVERHPNLGQTVNAYQALLSGEVNLYPEYSGSIVTEILKELPSRDASLVFQRARGEVKRTALLELLDPLGIDNPFVAVIRAGRPRESPPQTDCLFPTDPAAPIARCASPRRERAGIPARHRATAALSGSQSRSSRCIRDRD